MRETEDIFDTQFYGGRPLEELSDCYLPSPMNFRRIVLLAMRAYYAEAQNSTDPCLLWKGAGGDLRVDFAQENELEDLDPPAIIIRSGDQNYQQMSWGDIARTAPDDSFVQLAHEVTYPLTLRHILRTAEASRRLAENSVELVVALVTPHLLKAGASRVQPKTVGQAVVKKSQPDRYYGVDLTIEIAYHPLVTRSLESHRLRDIVMQTPTTANK